VYFDSNDTTKVAALSMNIFWAVLPSLLFFLLLTGTIKRGAGFGTSMLLSCIGMTIGYFVYAAIIKRLGVDLG